MMEPLKWPSEEVWKVVLSHQSSRLVWLEDQGNVKAGIDGLKNPC